MRSFVAGVQEVQIVGDGVLAAFLGGEQVDCHVEFSPSLILAAERSLIEGLIWAREGRVEVVDDSLEYSSWNILASFCVDNVDFNAPGAHGEAINVRWFVDNMLLGDKLDRTLDVGDHDFCSRSLVRGRDGDGDGHGDRDRRCGIGSFGLSALAKETGTTAGRSHLVLK